MRRSVVGATLSLHASGATSRFVRLLLSVALVTSASSAIAPVASAAERGGQAGRHGAAGPGSYISNSDGPSRFPLVASGKAAPLVVSASDFAGVKRVVNDLQADIKRVTNVEPAVATDTAPKQDNVVLIGTLGKSPLIDNLVSARKLDVSGIAGKWETSLEQVVQNPMPGVQRAFVVAGSDQRGTIFGAYDVSKEIGVSPWYWWDDVQPKHQSALYVLPGRHTQGTPAVKYRGLFINDENPALGRWAPKFFGPGKAPGFPGGFNKDFFAKVFEVMLRMKANYLWPAVWGRAFAEDDPENHKTATEYGVVMGTSHEAPMMRGIEEWNRHAVAAVRDSNGNIVTPGHDPYGGTGEWSFRRNADAVKAYWRDGIRRMKNEGFEGVVTLGMRGNGDTALPDGDAIDLMQNIISSERQILTEESGKPLTETPQVWTLYKEVQRYWDQGLRAPDDVTVVFTDDNWGNMRKLPDKSLPARSGGYGMYYHFDYVGDGRNYKWVDTANLANTWEQLNQAYTTGVDRLWVFNVGDMKNEELPLQFSLDYAWNPNSVSMKNLGEWEKRYAAQNFGTDKAAAIADVLQEYGRLQSRRKPELLNRHISLDSSKDLTKDPAAVVYDDQGNPYSLTNFQEHARVTAAWKQLAAKAEAIGRSLPASQQDAYYQLVLYEVKATANLYELRLAEFTNLLYAAQGRAATNDLAAQTEARFAEDLDLADFYNNDLAGGKWKDFQTQPHIDYGDVARYGPNAPWQQPEINNEAIPDVIFPAVKRIDVPAAADMGVAIDGSDKWWPNEQSAAVLPTFSPYQSQPGQYIEVFNRGQTAFDYQIKSTQPWVKVTPSSGRVGKQVRADVRVDWSRAPKGTTDVPLTVTGPDGKSVQVKAVVDNPATKPGGFVETNGYVSIEADHYTKAVNSGGVSWRTIPDIGRTGNGVKPFPVGAASQTPGGNSPRLEYKINLSKAGDVKLWTYLSPRNPVFSANGVRYAVSIDNEAPQIVNMTTATGANDTTMNRQWARNTSDNTNRTVTTHTIAQPGTHTIKFWMVDPTVVLQNLVVDTGGGDIGVSYLGPPESRQVR
jgi:hypothetical protein